MTTPADTDRTEGRLASTAEAVKNGASSAGQAVSEAAVAVSEKVSDVVYNAKETAYDAAAAVRDKAADAYDAAREKAVVARDQAATGIDTAPLLVLAGGIALGAVLAAILPRTERESKLLGPVAVKATDTARSAFAAAKSAGQEKLDELGINKEAARAKVDQLVDTASQAATSASAAATDSVRGRTDT